jgi:hypothetical protein
LPALFDILLRRLAHCRLLICLADMNPTRLTVVIAATLCMLPAWGQSGARELPTRSLTAGVHLITAEVAADESAREVGLMYRQALAPNHGMLFVFHPATKVCMWMRNTLIPLSVAFIEADGRIVNIEEMQANTDQTHCAKREVAFALEMARGWFAERSLKPGQTMIGGLPQQAQAPEN